MNSVRCFNCGFENPLGMAFCTNCGNSLDAQNASSGSHNSFIQSSAPVPNAPPISKKSGWGKTMAIFGGIGCLALLLGGGITLFGLLYYIGSNEIAKNTNHNAVVNNTAVAERNLANRTSANRLSGDANVRLNNGASSSDDGSEPSDDDELRSLLPSQIGQYEQQDDIVDGNVAEDYPGADKIVKSTYSKKNKKVAVIFARFNSPAVAKSSFENFLQGFKSAGAKVNGQQKVRNKEGIETGELAFYSNKGIYETMFYADKYGFRIVAPDRQSLIEFVQAFSSYVNKFGD